MLKNLIVFICLLTLNGCAIIVLPGLEAPTGPVQEQVVQPAEKPYLPPFPKKVLLLDIDGVITDITDSKLTEKGLRESKEKYKALFKYAGDALFIMDVSEEHGVRFLDCNEHTLKLFGCTHRDQIIGKTPVEFSPPIQPDGQPSVEKAAKLASDVMGGRPQRFEWKHCRLDGTPFQVVFPIPEQRIPEM